METMVNEKLDKALADLLDSIDSNEGGGLASSGAMDKHLECLRDELGLILREHAGMTDELLHAYEQLGIVFEVTRKLVTVSTEEEVIRIFVDSLGITYHDSRVFAVERWGDDRLKWTPTTPAHPDVVAEIVAECVRNSDIIVRPLGATDGDDNASQEDKTAGDDGEVLAAPMFSGDDFVCAIVLTHDAASRPFRASDMSLMGALVPFCGDLIRNYRLSHELRELSMNLVRALVSAVDQKDAYTSGHSTRVGHYAKLLGTELGMTDEELQMLEWAALLHDVGKIGIRDDVLNKPGKLTKEEFEHMMEHPVRSYDVVRQVPQLKAALDGIRYHHERFDGNGYPDRLAGEDIPLQARVIQVADIFDALTTSRSYRSAFGLDKALAILREEAGKVVDPNVMALFEQIVRREESRGGLICENPKIEPMSEDWGAHQHRKHLDEERK